MHKVKANAAWNKLSPEQLKTLDRWLFDEKLGFAEVLPKAQAELGFAGSDSSLQRYYRRREKERTMAEFEDLRAEVAALGQAPMDVNALRAAAMKILSAFLYKQVKLSPDKVKEWGAVANLIVDNDRNETLRELKGEEHKVRRELKAEDHKIRREAMAFAKEKFEFETMEKALEALPQLKELAEARKDPHTKRFVENAHWNLLRRKMFGPGIEIAPENAEEEAAMIAAKKEREERRAKEAQIERDKITKAQPPPSGSPYYQEYTEKLAKLELDDWKPGADYEI